MWAVRSRSRIIPFVQHRYRDLPLFCLPASRRPEQLQLQLQLQQQRRSYYYFPTSFEELRERLQLWAEKVEHRLVKVKLLSPQGRWKRFSQRRRQLYGFAGRTQARWNSWFHRERQGVVVTVDRSSSTPPSLPSLPLLPLPTGISDDQQHNRTTSIRSKYDGWKSTKKAQYQG